MRAVKSHDCSGICQPMSDQVDWTGVLFFTRLAVVISGSFDCSEEMEGEWRIENRNSSGERK